MVELERQRQLTGGQGVDLIGAELRVLLVGLARTDLCGRVGVGLRQLLAALAAGAVALTAAAVAVAAAVDTDIIGRGRTLVRGGARRLLHGARSTQRAEDEGEPCA